MTVDNLRPARFTKVHTKITGLNAKEALKKGTGLSTLTTDGFIINWYWECFLDQLNHIMILVHKEKHPNPKGLQWMTKNTQ